jgi:hypothetical protein
MDNGPRRDDKRARALSTRIDRAARDVNVFLLVLAVGLATLDLTCFCAFKMRDALPSAARASANPTLITQRARGSRPYGSLAAAAPTAPSAPTSW